MLLNVIIGNRPLRLKVNRPEVVLSDRYRLYGKPTKVLKSVKLRTILDRQLDI